jgi:putative transposase
LQEGQSEGQSATCRKYNIAPSLYQQCKHKYLEKGVDGLKPSYKRVDPEKRALEEENERLKKIVVK